MHEEITSLLNVELSFNHYQHFGFGREKFSFFFFFRATFVAYGDSQARVWIGDVATGLRHIHSNTGSKPPLRPTPEIMAMLDP